MNESGVVILIALNIVLVVIIATMYFIWYQLNKNMQALKQQQLQEREINKKAILHLLDEMVDLYADQPGASGCLQGKIFNSPVADAACHFIQHEYPQAFVGQNTRVMAVSPSYHKRF